MNWAPSCRQGVVVHSLTWSCSPAHETCLLAEKDWTGHLGKFQQQQIPGAVGQTSESLGHPGSGSGRWAERCDCSLISPQGKSQSRDRGQRQRNEGPSSSASLLCTSTSFSQRMEQERELEGALEGRCWKS